MTTRNASPWILVLPLLSACQGVVYGNLAVLAVTIGIFMGTITLGRSRD